MTQLDELIRAAPRWHRPGMRALFALASRPRGIKLLQRVPPIDQAAAGLLALIRYDDPTLARRLAWDAERVATRGRALRTKERRP